MVIKQSKLNKYRKNKRRLHLGICRSIIPQNIKKIYCILYRVFSRGINYYDTCKIHNHQIPFLNKHTNVIVRGLIRINREGVINRKKPNKSLINVFKMFELIRKAFSKKNPFKQSDEIKDLFGDVCLMNQAIVLFNKK